MLNVLIPVDGSASANRAVRFVIGLYPKLAPMHVRVLHVQVPDLLPLDRSVSSARAQGSSSESQDSPTRAATNLLDAANVPYLAEVRRGHVPQVIASYVKDTGCSAVVMGTRGMGSTEQVLGSIARQVVNLVNVPVTLVK